MSLSMCVNGKVYRLSDKFKQRIESIAENEYGENGFLSYYWRTADGSGDHEKGDPILCIETEGTQVPWERLSEFELDVQHGEQIEKRDDAEPTERDNGNGVKTVDRDSVDMEDHDSQDDDMQDFKMTMNPQNFRPIPDPDDGKYSTWVPEPEEYNDEDGSIVVLPIPENQRDERWAAGTALVPLFTTVEWNVQRRADTVPSYGQTRHGDSHDEWEQKLEETGCEVTGTTQPKNPPKEDDSSEDMYDADNDMGPRRRDGNANWQI